MDLKNIRHFNPKLIDKRFKAPHYLAISPNGHLLVSNGWGRSIVEIEDIDGSGWKEFNGLAGSEFKANSKHHTEFVSTKMVGFMWAIP